MKKSSGKKEKRRKSRTRDSKDSKSKFRGSTAKEERKRSPKEPDPKSEEPVTKNPEADKDVPVSGKSLSNLIQDKELMIEQLFAHFRDSDLAELTPKTLKGYNTDQLKKMCLKELKGMSDGLVLHVLRGKDMNIYVEEHGTGKDISAEKHPKVTETKSDDSLKRKQDEAPEIPSGAKKKRCLPEASQEEGISEQVESISEDSVLELCPSAKDVEKLNVEIKKEDVVDRDLELLELEMRARAIRSLLRARGLAASEEDDDAAGKVLKDGPIVAKET